MKEKALLLALSLGSVVITLIAQSHGGAVKTFSTVPLGWRLVNAPIAYITYLRKTIWPDDLACFYPHPALLARPGASLSAPLVFLAVLLLAAATLAALYALRSGSRRQWLGVGWLWFLGTLVPVLGLVQVGEQAWADRYTYIPSIGIAVMVAFFLKEAAAAGRTRRVICTLLSLCAVAACGITARSQVRTWKDDRALYGQALAVTADNWFVHNNLGMTMKAGGNLPQAAEHFRESMRIKPDYPEAHNNLGTVLLEQNMLDEAENHFRRAFDLRGGYVEAHMNLGVLHTIRGEPDRAIYRYEQALRFDPNMLEAHFNMANIFVSRGEPDRAVPLFEKVIRLYPDYAPAHNNLGMIHLGRGEFEKAASAFERALRIDPDYELARRNLHAARVR